MKTDLSKRLYLYRRRARLLRAEFAVATVLTLAAAAMIAVAVLRNVQVPAAIVQEGTHSGSVGTNGAVTTVSHKPAKQP
jgi:hypothetical protein